MVAPRELVSKHKLLSESEAKKVLKALGLAPEKLPKILDSDPQAKKLNARAGQLIEIERQDPAGKYPYYRYVVKG